MRDEDIAQLIKDEDYEKYRADDVVARKYEDYARSTIEDRALPDVRDGLKPVQRRIIFALQELNTTRFVKSSRVTGDVNGKYHPHGDMAIYETCVRMARCFMNLFPILDGQGNFGSSEYNAAAQRYTEIRLSAYAKEFFYYFNLGYSEMKQNYDGTFMEPVVFIPRVPNLLVNGCHGIAVGLRTSIPSHNLGELLRGLLMYIDNPHVTIHELMQVIQGPDFPTGGAVSSYASIYKFYSTGEGHVDITARYNLEDNKIVFYEIPYNTNKSEIVKEISELADADEIQGIRMVRDESDQKGIRVVVACKNGFDPDVVANKIKQKTRMKIRMSLAFFAINSDRKPCLYSLPKYFEEIVNSREKAVFDKARDTLEKHKKRLHILIGLYVALTSIDFVVNQFRKAESIQDVKEVFLSHSWECDEQLLSFLTSVGLSAKNGTYKLSEEQVGAIADMHFRSLIKLEFAAITKETTGLRDKIRELNTILTSRQARIDILKEEYNEMLEKYKTPRKSQIFTDDFTIEDINLINPRSVIVICDHRNYVKRIDLENYRLQNRGGQGRNSTDVCRSVFACTRDRILFFLKSGQVFSKYVYEIPEGNHDTAGRALVNLLPIASDDALVCMFAYDSQNNEVNKLNVLFVFSDGTVRKNLMSEFTNLRQNGKIYVKEIPEGVHLVNVLFGRDDQYLFLAKHMGRAARISIGSFRVMQSRSSTGVIGCKMKNKEDFVVSALIVNENDKILTVTSSGYGKISNVSSYSVTNRGAFGVKNIGRNTSKIGNVAGCVLINDKTNEVIIGTSSGKVVRQSIATVRTSSRASGGVKFVTLTHDSSVNGDSVVKYIIGVTDEV